MIRRFLSAPVAARRWHIYALAAMSATAGHEAQSPTPFLVMLTAMLVVTGAVYAIRDRAEAKERLRVELRGSSGHFWVDARQSPYFPPPPSGQGEEDSRG